MNPTLETLSRASLFILAATVLPVAADPPPEPPAQSFAVVDVRIFDGQDALAQGTVIVEDGIVTELGPDVVIPAGLPTVDGTGATLLPGLIDSHTHTWGTGLERAIVFGVTTHLDMFTAVDFSRDRRSEQAAGKASDRTDLFSAGTLATTPGGHGTQFGIPIPTLTTPAEADAFVEARLAEGSDFLKIVSEDGSGFGRELPTLDRPTVAALIRAAEKREMLAVVHATILDRARSAIEDGADGLVHLFSDQPATESFVDLMADRGSFVVPTLTVVQSTTGVASGASLVEDEHLAPYLTREERSNLNRSFPGGEGDFGFAMSAVADLHAAGVPILAGSDAPNPATGYGASLHRELELLVEAGLPPTVALAAATSVPAEVFSLSDRGRIEPGRRADLVLVGGDPTVDIKATRNILQVWKGGHPVARPEADGGSAVPTPDVPPSGLVSDFARGEITATFGAGWAVSTDDFMGGTSTARIAPAASGPDGGHALEVSGTVQTGFAFPWAGALFYPGETQMGATDLSGFRGFAFRSRSEGDAPGGSYRVMVFAESLGMRPAEKRFPAGSEWETHAFDFGDFGVDGSDITGIFFGAGPAAGDFQLQVDDLRLIAEDPSDAVD